LATEISTYLKYAHLQLAAEALCEPQTASADTSASALAFARDWQIIEHLSNTATGLSGTLFQALRSHEVRGVVARELVLSFCSSEFIGDAAWDDDAGEAPDIREQAQAFRQINDMREWVDSLYSRGKIHASSPLTVTGYRLGSRPVTAFTLLYPRAARATYSFDKAAVEALKNADCI
jgi:hypothetical protein